MEKRDKSKEILSNENKTILGLKSSLFFFKLLWAPALCLIVMLCLKWDELSQKSVLDYVYYIIQALFPAFLSIVILEFGFHKYIQKESKKELEQTINKMFDDKTPMLASFSKKKLIGILCHILALLIGDTLANKFVKSMMNELILQKFYRRDFKYIVEFQKNKDGVQEIEQELIYCKCLKLNEDKTEFKRMAVIFTFHCDPFIRKAVDSDVVVFFCEELTSDNLINNIIENKKKRKQIGSLLNLRIWIHSVETEITNYDIEFLPSLGNSKYPYAGILITFDLLSDYWDIDEEEISLWCKLICRYPNEQRKFYWKFSEAILGDRSAIDFTLRFKEGTSGKDVDYIQYFTGSNVNVERPIPLNDKITFHSNGNYFPESGIYFHW